MRRFAREKLKHWLRLFLHTQDSPERTALAFALGVFIAFLPPIPWVHTLFALLLAFVFRLNRVAVLAGSYMNTPFTMAPLLILEVSTGLALMGGGEPPDITWRQLSAWQGWKDAVTELKPFVQPLLLGCLLLGLAASVVGYFLCLLLVSRYRRRQAVAALSRATGSPKAAAVDTPENHS